MNTHGCSNVIVITLRLPFSQSLLLFLLVTLQLFPQPSYLYSDNNKPPPHYQCVEICNQHRPADSIANYTLACDDETFNDQEKADCKVACIYCHSLKVCDRSIIPVKIYCPSLNYIDGECKQRCDYHRPENFNGPFSFGCSNSTLFQTKWERRGCLRDCRECPSNVCDFMGTDFHCPAVNYAVFERPTRPTEPAYDGSKCEWRCDNERPAPSERDNVAQEDSYQLDCDEKYKSNDEQRATCVSDCSSCPLDICDFEFEAGRYSCPPSKHTPLLHEPHKRGSFIVSWIIIAVIAVSIIGCIVGATFYGKIDGFSCGCTTQTRTHRPENIPGEMTEEDMTPQTSGINAESLMSASIHESGMHSEIDIK